VGASSKILAVEYRVDTILDTTKASNVGLPPEPEGWSAWGVEARYDE